MIKYTFTIISGLVLIGLSYIVEHHNKAVEKANQVKMVRRIKAFKKANQMKMERINDTHRVLHICLSSEYFGPFETLDFLYAIFKQEFVYSGQEYIVRYLSDNNLVKPCSVAYLCFITGMVDSWTRSTIWRPRGRPTLDELMQKIEDFGITKYFRDLDFIIGPAISTFRTKIMNSTCFVPNADNGGIMQLFHKLFRTRHCTSEHVPIYLRNSSDINLNLIINDIYTKYKILGMSRSWETTCMLFMFISGYIEENITTNIRFRLRMQ